jgi:hypothetical protein
MTLRQCQIFRIFANSANEAYSVSNMLILNMML